MGEVLRSTCQADNITRMFSPKLRL